MLMVDAVNESINAAIDAGTLDPKKQSAPICALLKMAEVVDAGVSEKDNVTFPTMLKYMVALGMMPQEVKEVKMSISKTDRLKGKFSKFGGKNAEG
ncbi:MAG: hypothetical protein IKE43_09420 [Coriobacteriales bacterium]|nr:hypothetical protein [Coriobacteriales bacterium]